MVDAEKIEKMCRMFVDTSSTVNYACRKDEPDRAHLWHGADTACRLIIAGANFDDFSAGTSHNCPEVCPDCIEASPGYEDDDESFDYEAFRKRCAEADAAAEVRSRYVGKWMGIMYYSTTLPGIALMINGEVGPGIAMALFGWTIVLPFTMAFDEHPGLYMFFTTLMIAFALGIMI